MISKRDELINRGFCVFENVLTREMVARVDEAADGILAAQGPEYFEANKSPGSVLTVFDDEFFADLIAWPPALEILNAMGYDRPVFASGFVISKPPYSPSLFWHQDWWGWNDPVSYQPLPLQVFLMYYLVDTTIENGCLRLIEGSHLKRHPLHDAVPEAHTEDLRRASDPDHPAYQSFPEEVDVPVKAGDLVMGDSRMLHSAHANKTDQKRTVITLWYYPRFYEFSEGMRARLANKHPKLENWSEEAQKKIEPLNPVYEGDCDELEWSRIPGPELV